MTEEIIIDGVDVAGCSLYLKDNGKCLRLLTDNEPETECNAICDYGCLYHKEQLKRLELERNDLQDRMLTLADTYQEARDTCKRLEQENKELKEENIKVKKEFNNLIAEIISDTEYTGEIACNGESPKEHLKNCQKALKALEEINILAKNYCNACDEFKAKTYKNKNDCLYCNYGFIKRNINACESRALLS